MFASAPALCTHLLGLRFVAHSKWIDDGDPGSRKIPSIVRYDREIVVKSCRCDERVDCGNRLAAGCETANHSAPAFGNGGIDRKYAAAEPVS